MPGLRNGIFASSVSVVSGCAGVSSAGASAKKPPKSPPQSSSPSASSAFATGCSWTDCAGVSGAVGLAVPPAPPPSAWRCCRIARKRWRCSSVIFAMSGRVPPPCHLPGPPLIPCGVPVASTFFNSEVTSKVVTF